MTTRHAGSVLLGATLVVAGCYQGLSTDDPGLAESGEAGSSASAGGTEGESDSEGDDGDSDPPPAGFEPVPGPMKRLTVEQYHNSIHDIFGEQIVIGSPLEIDETAERFLSIGASHVGTSETGVSQYREAAFDIAAQVFANRSDYPLLAECQPTGADDPCVAAIVEHYGRLLWRRPLTAQEVNRYAALVATEYEEGTNYDLGLQYALAGLIESPKFIYIASFGEDDPASEFTRYTSLEMASRLSYVLWNSTPDDELLSVAETGDLVRVDTIIEQAERMLEADRAVGLASRFFAEAWFVTKLDITSKNEDLFPEWTEDRVASYKWEFDRVLQDIVEREGDIRELFDGKETFVDETLAELYGVPAPASPDDPVVLDETRWGLLTSGAVMAANAPSNRTSPTVRGKFLYERLLCEEVPPPPDDVDDVLPDDPPGEPPTTTREKLEQHRADPVCAACHALIDPMGLALENYDAVGAFRESENGLPIDASSSYDGENFEGVADLATYLASEERATDCIAQNLLSYAIGLDVTEEDAETVGQLAKKLRRADHSFRALVLELVTHPTFRYLALEEQD